jgi:hypothetical protein
MLDVAAESARHWRRRMKQRPGRRHGAATGHPVGVKSNETGNLLIVKLHPPAAPGR